MAKLTLRISKPHIAELERRVRMGRGSRVSALAAELIQRAIDDEEEQDAVRGRGRPVDGLWDAVEEIKQTVTELSDFAIRQEKATETLSALILYSAMRLQESVSQGQRSRDELKTAAYAEARRLLGKGSGATSNDHPRSSVGTQEGKKNRAESQGD